MALNFRALEDLFEPISKKEFYDSYWEIQPLLCSRQNVQFFKGLISLKIIEKFISQYVFVGGKDIDIVKCENEKVCILNIVGNEEIWEPEETREEENIGVFDLKEKSIKKYLSAGSVIKFLQPQKYSDTLWRFLFCLESSLNSQIDCIVSLVPAGVKYHSLKSEDANIIILQLEGSSSVTVFKPVSATQELSLWRSHTVTASAYQASGKIEAILNPGDSLYIPKGWYFSFSGCTGEQASLSIQLRTSMYNTYSHLLDIVLPQAVLKTVTECIDMRRSLPLSVGSFLGVSSEVHEEIEDENDDTNIGQDRKRKVADIEVPPAVARLRALKLKRQKFIHKVKSLLERVVDETLSMLDVGVDQMMKQFVGARMPPFLTESQETKTSGGWKSFDGHPPKIGPLSRLAVISTGIARIVVEDGVLVLYHCNDNSREMHGSSLNPLEFELDDGPAIEKLLASTVMEGGVIVSDLPHNSEEVLDKIGIAESLFKEGLLMLIDDEVEKDKDDLFSLKENTAVDSEQSDDEVVVAEEPEVSLSGSSGSELNKNKKKKKKDRRIKSNSTPVVSPVIKVPVNTSSEASPNPFNIREVLEKKRYSIGGGVVRETDSECPF